MPSAVTRVAGGDAGARLGAEGDRGGGGAVGPQVEAGVVAGPDDDRVAGGDPAGGVLQRLPRGGGRPGGGIGPGRRDVQDGGCETAFKPLEPGAEAVLAQVSILQ